MFAAGLGLLWIALQLIPSAADEPLVYSDESGSVVASTETLPTYEGPRLLSYGNVAALIFLAGGGAFAYFLHKRSQDRGSARSWIEPIGELGVGQGQQLRLVRCGGEVLLIGVTANQITLLREFDLDSFDDFDAEPGDTGLDNGLDNGSDNESDGKPEAPSTPRQLGPIPARSHFADVLRQYAGRFVNVHSNGTSC